jgi:hypothetical protein
MAVIKSSLSFNVIRSDQPYEISSGDITQTPTLAHKGLYVVYKSNKQSQTKHDGVKLPTNVT